MRMQRIIGPSLAGIIALGSMGAAIAQTPSVPANPPSPNNQMSPGARSSATYPIPNGTLTVKAGMTAQVQQFGPPPSFKSLDTNGNDRLSHSEAKAYPPLDNGFLYASGGNASITPAQYRRWVHGPR